MRRRTFQHGFAARIIEQCLERQAHMQSGGFLQTSFSFAFEVEAPRQANIAR